MYLVSYAFQNILRNKGRYSLIGAVLTVSIASVVVSAMIHIAAGAAIDGYAERFGARATFAPDLRKLFALTKPDENGMYHDPEITTGQYLAISKSDAVKNTLFYGSRQTYGKDLFGFDQGGEENYYAFGGNDAFQALYPPEEEAVRRQAPNTVVIGYSDISMLEDFALGLRELDEGSFFGEYGECIVSRDFAELNGIKLGDTICLSDVNHTEVPEFSLKVCGIYLDITTPQTDGLDWAVNNRRNEILTSFSTISGHSLDGLYVRAEYILKNPERAAEFEAYAKECGLHEIYHVNVDAESYDRIVKPVKGLKSISSVFLAVVLSVGCLILTFLSVLGIRERKYEIGVLRAMGMEKRKVAFSLVGESVLILAVCLCIGLTAGSLAAPPVCGLILDGQRESGSLYAQEKDGAIASGGEHTDGYASGEIEITLSLESVLFTIAVSLFLGLLSNLAGLFHIMRYEPVKILSERS